MEERGINMDLVCYAIIIHGILDQKDSTLVIKSLKEIHDRGLRPDDFIYTSFIDKYGKTGDLAMAMAHWDLMISVGFGPNVVTYTAMINSLCKGGLVRKAEVLFKEMLVSGIFPNEITHGCFLDHLTREGNMEEAKRLHKAMLKGFHGSTVSYNMLIRGFCKLGRIQEASQTLTKMSAKGISPAQQQQQQQQHQRRRSGSGCEFSWSPAEPCKVWSTVRVS
ncbi:putative pentatricopeptide repeat-containing protein At5g59900 [Salvia splendens]|uniref:putative pentatricopeptide repeat-containing protein At5g59900 n=1 Tax=Salvia splendens TaxID=180675 RepID=UPI001C262F56|nr:putative pentatricopeptide repeat-containing protein At5g59900 [Salvia splendens]